jgi:hypothetical protein
MRRPTTCDTGLGTTRRSRTSESQWPVVSGQWPVTPGAVAEGEKIDGGFDILGDSIFIRIDGLTLEAVD